MNNIILCGINITTSELKRLLNKKRKHESWLCENFCDICRLDIIDKYKSCYDCEWDICSECVENVFGIRSLEAVLGQTKLSFIIREMILEKYLFEDFKEFQEDVQLHFDETEADQYGFEFDENYEFKFGKISYRKIYQNIEKSLKENKCPHCDEDLFDQYPITNSSTKIDDLEIYTYCVDGNDRCEYFLLIENAVYLKDDLTLAQYYSKEIANEFRLEKEYVHDNKESKIYQHYCISNNDIYAKLIKLGFKIDRVMTYHIVEKNI